MTQQTTQIDAGRTAVLIMDFQLHSRMLSFLMFLAVLIISGRCTIEWRSGGTQRSTARIYRLGFINNTRCLLQSMV